jgi:hypothetical protein
VKERKKVKREETTNLISVLLPCSNHLIISVKECVKSFLLWELWERPSPAKEKRETERKKEKKQFNSKRKQIIPFLSCGWSEANTQRVSVRMSGSD